MPAIKYQSRSGVPVISGRVYDVLAQYINDEPVCVDCDPRPDADAIAIFAEAECDAPEHCVRCGALIACRLTDYGQRYVREAYEAERTAITEAWREVFGHAWR